jgi:hypothetical protein
VTAKIARVPNIRIYEVGISYYGRTYEEGKKIGWRDGFRAIYCIVKYNLFKRRAYRKAYAGISAADFRLEGLTVKRSELHKSS